ncbi:MAG: ATP-binding cassette domain-containing protein [Thaumarchaeota archaeon]|nr:ATP-binding cassette domain-containing protein [Nitrososphaerota archaeon]MCL5318403.1 ATP-binding cassette domain-containing protein [Nitrososphaerota archaeon]
MSIIKTVNLSKRYGALNAVDGLNLEIEEGEIFGLLGPNGAGKTTTIHMLATLLRPSSGTASVNGFDIEKQAGDVRRSIGLVFQEPSSDDILTGYENLRLHAMLYGVPWSVARGRMEDLLKIVDLSERRNDLVRTYSGGMRRRLELARGLLHRPKVLFLDEPTLGLDPQSRVNIWGYIKRMVSEEHVTVILTTHYMEEADMLCDRVGIIDSGRIVILDSPGQLKKVVGGDIIRLRIQRPKLDELSGLKYVKSVDVKEDVVTLMVEDAGRHLQQILGLIGDVESVEMRSPTLNDVFLHYTGREIRETAPEGGFYERVATVRSGR